MYRIYASHCYYNHISMTVVLRRPAWLVSSAVQVRGVAALLGRIDSTSSSGADRLRGDALNAEICAAIASPWKSTYIMIFRWICSYH